MEDDIENRTLSVILWEFRPQIFILRRLAGYEEWCESAELNDFNIEAEEIEYDTSDEETDKRLMLLDPKDWKQQDHYEVLSLKKARWRASEEHIRLAYRKKLLKHHPDKRQHRTPVRDSEHDYFTCITRAFETLSDRTKRRSYDSVDPEFDDSIPSKSEVTNANFFEIFSSVFERNAHFSNRRPVPGLGKPLSSRNEVERFYHFWYSFDSWREFSYLDEEVPEKTENREERRYYDRINRAQRQKKRNEEVKRIRQLVDVAMETDPRIVRFKEEDRIAAINKKKARKDATRLKLAEEQRAKEERERAEKQAKEEEAARVKAEQQKMKQEREKLKRLIKEEKKKLASMLNGVNYFATNNTSRLENMDTIQSYIDVLSLEQLQELNKSVVSDMSTDDLKSATLEKAIKYKEDVRKSHIESTAQSASQKSANTSSGGDNVIWTNEMVQHLIKGFNLFPSGTQQRWETIASYINQRIPDMEPSLNGKLVMKKAKSMQKNDSHMKEEVNAKAYDSFSKTVASSSSGATSDITVRYDKENAKDSEAPANSTWTLEEQKLLEQALRTFSAPTPDKWDKISGVVGTKTKKECILRFKELAVQIKAKKEAAAAAAANTAKKAHNAKK